MHALIKISGLALALGLCSGAASAAPDGPLCDHSGTCIGATHFNIHQKGWKLRTLQHQPRRYACDAEGWNCRYTSAYYISDDGNARWDPSLAAEQGED